MTGNNAGQVLSGSRMLFALAEHGELPAFFGRIHARFRTPANAILFTSAIALALALTGSFAKLAVVSALARLVTYTGACASTLRLRAPAFAGRVKPATFVAPWGPVVPIVAIAVSMAVVAGATRQQLFGGFAALAGGALLFAANSLGRTSPGK
jgi:amino acid transporter